MSQNVLTNVDWYALETHEVIDRLNTDSNKGLSSKEALNRLKIYGLNTLKSNGRPKWYKVLARQFVDVLVIILFIATFIAFALGEMEDAIAILAIVILNGILGFSQEWKAEKAMDALKRMLSLRCTVLRDCIEREIDVTELVPGDIVLLEIGDKIPADIRLLESINLKTDESALTGESYSVSKDSKAVHKDTELALITSMVFMGTSVTNGHAKGVVVTTNMNTEFGKIAYLTKTVEKETTPLQKKLATLGKQLGIFSIAISALIAFSGFLLGKSVLDMFFTGISLAVAVVPEGLPAVVTITMALGIRAMAKRKALLRRLRSAETLGSATVICSDKTGTLTRNEMTVTRVWLPTKLIQVTGVGYSAAGHFEIDKRKIDYNKHSDLLELLNTGMICNNSKLIKDEEGWHPLGEPTEASLIVLAYKAWLQPQDKSNIISEFSFNSTRKRMTVIARHEEGWKAHVKGAPEIILDRCSYIKDGDTIRPLTETDKMNFTQAYLNMGKDGLRTLAIANRLLPKDIQLEEDMVEKDLTLIGMVGIIDPPRPEVLKAIQVARMAGIKTIMITGDAALTALTIAKRIGINANRAITGADLDKMDDDELRDELFKEIIFARVTPEHKLRIIELLQSMGHVVGMTGDGVNDAPALKKSDIGIAMGIRGTDVAKEASDMILTDDNFASIINAVEEGRRQYANIKKFIRFLLSSNTGEVIAIFLSIISGSPLILLPVQILWMNLVTDGVIAMALGVEPVDKNIMRQKPKSPKEPIMNRSSIIVTILLGSYIGIITFWLFYHYFYSSVSQNQLVAQTVAFTGIIVLEKINVFNFRSFNMPLLKVGFFSNYWLLIAWMFSIGLQVLAVYTPLLQKMLHTVPLRLEDWGFIFLISLPILIVPEVYKSIMFKRI